MGSSASKAARTAGAASARKYPTRVPNPVPSSNTTTSNTTTSNQTAAPVRPQPSQAGPSVHPPPQASESRDEAITRDSRDPDFDARLRQVGPVQPNPTFSPSSTSQTQPSRSASSSPVMQRSGQAIYPSPSANPAIAILAARQRIQEQAEKERAMMGQPDFEGRSLLDIKAVRQVLMLRDEQSVPVKEIEKMLRLKPGTVDKLGRRGAIEAA